MRELMSWFSMHFICLLYTSETGSELIYFDPQNDPTQQASQIDDMIASGIDALIYIPYDSAGAQTVLQLSLIHIWQQSKDLYIEFYH